MRRTGRQVTRGGQENRRMAVERRLVQVDGVVQGVGFRPHVLRLAAAHRLAGRVSNAPHGVTIDLEGTPDALEAFLGALPAIPPPARVERLAARPVPLQGYIDFQISPSRRLGMPTARVTPDVATCPECLAELRDPANRRFGYPFLNCIRCGPRFTIVCEIPYDRPATTMAAFTMCPACEAEYTDQRDRRLHAQPNACPQCGPVLRYEGAGSGEPAVADPLDMAAGLLRAGRIVAIKGLGGYHLACDATSADAVRRLRERKRREAKPFAVMMAGLDTVRTACVVSDAEAAALTDPAAPIVLLERRAGAAIAGQVAPGTPCLGVMLPYTPLHHLLLEAAGRPLVMTSGNQTDEPIAFGDADARRRLAAIADGFLLHDRPIATRCDDSVVRVHAGAPRVLRRARGHAPSPVALARAFPCEVLAVGGHLKNAFCLGRGYDAYLSHHIGDLETPGALAGLRDGIAHYRRLFDLRPVVVAHDLHPDYASTGVAEELDLPAVGVQHHHAHVVSCMAEHGLAGPVIGVAFDGAGLGGDGTVWGGEFLVVDEDRWERAGHLACVPLPGGDAAARAPWRMALAHLWAAFGNALPDLDLPVVRETPANAWPLLRRMLGDGVRSPATSSAGRLFDAVAALAGIRREARFEAQAAMELEALADRSVTATYPFDIFERGQVVVADAGPLIRAVVDDRRAGTGTPVIAAAFHRAMVDLILSMVGRIAARTGIRDVCLTGGVFQNALLTDWAAAELRKAGYGVYLHERVPCNDGGLALGQAVVAARTVEG